MRISAGGTNICVPENFLHFVQTTPCIDQKACEAVTKVVDAQFGKLRSSSGGIPTWPALNVDPMSVRVLVYLDAIEDSIFV